ncbi:alanine dehydrogenase [Nitratidesulfovibrio termitidis]|uniref:alanine dehydrogenase n=1 Tax=Nitratidesulfovibrio termitidis TaxID=42252 RepID=UPI00041377F6|nr:alanine dehydrogenase [Nitratidesulfovibrio termitidis]
MHVGILKEIKVLENRVAMTPAGVVAMRAHGHLVMVETGAGIGAGFADAEYVAAGATMTDARTIFSQCEMVMHVKEPQPSEYGLLRKDQILFTYLHLAADEEQTHALVAARNVNIAYETIQKADGSLPLLTPMSEVAGRMAIQQAAKYLEIPTGGMGKLMGGVPGVEPAVVVVIGGGIVGINAAKMACGLGATVYLLDKNLDRLRYLSDVMPANCITMMSGPYAIRKLLPQADVVIGAVLVPGAKTPHLVTREDLKLMRKGAILVDVAIDQGGCFETSRPTTHAEPVYVVDGVNHYCVANIPGAVAMTSTAALTNATLPYALAIADLGWKEACRRHEDIRKGLNVVNGKITYPAVAEAFGLPHVPAAEML